MLAPSAVIVRFVSLPGSSVVRGKVTVCPSIVPWASPATAVGRIVSLKRTVTLPLAGEDASDSLAYELRNPGASRLLYVADAFRAGWSLERIHELSYIDPWFLAQIEDLLAAQPTAEQEAINTALVAVRDELRLHVGQQSPSQSPSSSPPTPTTEAAS